MKALTDLFSTDYGLMSIIGIGFMKSFHAAVHAGMSWLFCTNAQG